MSGGKTVPSRHIEGLLEIMAALRTPVTGCPWDLEQDFASIAPYTIEEAYEVADAIQRGDLVDLRDELGDLLLQPLQLQVVTHPQVVLVDQVIVRRKCRRVRLLQQPCLRYQ